MYDLIHELSKFTLHSSKSAEFIQEDLEALQSNHNVINVKITIFDLTLLAEENNNIINKLILEFCFYIIYLNNYNNDDDIDDKEVSQLFDD